MEKTIKVAITVSLTRLIAGPHVEYLVFSVEEKLIWRNQTTIVITILICVKGTKFWFAFTVGLEVLWHSNGFRKNMDSMRKC